MSNVAKTPLRFRQESVRNVAADTLPREHRTLLVRGQPRQKQNQGIAASVKISTERSEVALANPVSSPTGDPNPARTDFENPLIRTTSDERPADATHLALTKRDAQQ
jgi:hypothetical protein